jgi:hypothetical protein
LGKLRTQKLGIGVGIAFGVVLSVAIGAALLLVGVGRDSKTSTPARPAPRGKVVYTLRWGDVVRDPRTGTRCEATGEGGLPNLYCTHTVRGRYAAVFWNDELTLYGPGSEPLTPSRFFAWWPLIQCEPPRGPRDKAIHSANLLVANISCNAGRNAALACRSFTYGRSGTCSTAGYRWHCTSTSPPGLKSAQHCVAGRRWMSILWLD